MKSKLINIHVVFRIWKYSIILSRAVAIYNKFDEKLTLLCEYNVLFIAHEQD